MKLYIRQKVLSLRDRFRIYDEAQQDLYYVEGELFSFSKKLHLYDANMVEQSFIQQKLITFLPKYTVTIDGVQVAEVVKKLTFLKPHYVVNGPGWDVTGDFLAHNYTICGPHGAIATVSKRWLAWGDTYEIDIPDSRNVILALSIVLIIDAVLAQEGAAASTSSANS